MSPARRASPTQCAAVTTVWSVIIVPPQNEVPNDVCTHTAAW
jgi:hypothetical protein